MNDTTPRASLVAGVLAILCATASSAQEEERLKLEGTATIRYKVKLEGPKPDRHSCQASISISYLQFDTRARVDSVIENGDCAASGGEYVVRLRVRDDNGETRTIEYPETWARDDAAPVEAQTFYDIGPDVDLRRASTAKLTCACKVEEDASEPE